MAKLAGAKPEDSTYGFCCGEDMDMKITGFLYQQEREGDHKTSIRSELSHHIIRRCHDPDFPLLASSLHVHFCSESGLRQVMSDIRAL